MQHFDYIFAGGGCAALSLVSQLVHSPLKHKKILVIDKVMKNQNDRTWCFWTNQPIVFDKIVYKNWKNISFITEKYEQSYLLNDYTYKMIRGIDFYKEVNIILSQYPNIIFEQDEVITLEEKQLHVVVKTTKDSFVADWVFDSRFYSEKYSVNAQSYHYLLQHFKGWVIQTTDYEFDSDRMTMFDFRVTQENEVRFFYCLPFSQHNALIEYTIFGKNLAQANYDNMLKKYIEDTLKIKRYSVQETEFGIIPMTDYPFTRHGGARIMNIGIQGGQAKASTGYTFLNIQRDSELIINSLLTTAQPFYNPIFNKQFELYDKMILEIMCNKGGSIKDIFTQLFQKNPIERVLAFLNNETHFGQDLGVMWSVPSSPFLKSLWEVAKKELKNNYKNKKH